MSRILIFSYLPPASLAGGPLRSIDAIIKSLGLYHTFFVISPSKEIDGTVVDYKCYDDNIVQGLSLHIKDVLSPYYVYSFCKRNKIDVIYLNSLFNIRVSYSVFIISLFLKFKLILAPRGELEAGALKKNNLLKNLYIFLFKCTFVKRVDVFHSTSMSEYQNIKLKLDVGHEKVVKIPNLRLIEIEDKYFQSSTKFKNSLNLVFFSRIVPKKNLVKLLELLLGSSDLIGSLDIYGYVEDLKYWGDCLRLVDKFANISNFKVSYKGLLDADQNAFANQLSSYDFFIFPTLSENFGHVIIEALAVGIPVILNNTTPFTNDVNKYNLGYAFDFNNKKIFYDVLSETYHLDTVGHLDLKQNIRLFLQGYKLSTFDKIVKYNELFN